MTLLSIVVPVYNASPWLAVALESCLWQTHQDLEVLVVNDSSLDNSGEIAAYYADLDARLRVIVQKNAGPGGARQRGQDEASGDFITFMDADDFLAPRAAELWLEAAARHGADLVCGNAVAFLERSLHARRYFPHPEAANLHFDSAPRYWKSKVLWRWAFSLPLLRQRQLRHERFMLGQDVLFMFEALLAARSFAQVKDDLYYFRQEHKSAHASLETLVEHGFAHFIRARQILLEAPDGLPRLKPLVKYLSENYWRDIKKAAPRLTGEDAFWEDRIIELGLELFDGLQAEALRAACLAPELRGRDDFLPFAEAMIARDIKKLKNMFAALRAGRLCAGGALGQDSSGHDLSGQDSSGQDLYVQKPSVWEARLRSLRHHLKAALNPRSWRTRLLLRRLEAAAASRKGLPGPTLDLSLPGGRGR